MAGSSKIGRNAPCPCGSGKKYKKCCMRRHEAARSESAPAGPATGSKSSPAPPAPAVSSPGFTYVVAEIDELSNSVVDLIDEGRLDEAEERCQELRERYPETVDWIMRLAAVYEAREDWKRAAEYYRRAADFAEQNDGFDQDAIDDFRDTASRLKEKAGK